MKAIRIHEYGDASTLRLEEAPCLSPGNDQLLVHVRDAGVNPVDWKIRQGTSRMLCPRPFPCDRTGFCGRGCGNRQFCHRFRSRCSVFGFAHGSYAEYALASVSTVAQDAKGNGFRDRCGPANGRFDRIADCARRCGRKARHDIADPGCCRGSPVLSRCLSLFFILFRSHRQSQK